MAQKGFDTLIVFEFPEFYRKILQNGMWVNGYGWCTSHVLALGIEADAVNGTGVSFECLLEGALLVVPELDGSIVTATSDHGVRGMEMDGVDCPSMAFERVFFLGNEGCGAISLYWLCDVENGLPFWLKGLVPLVCNSWVSSSIFISSVMTFLDNLTMEDHFCSKRFFSRLELSGTWDSSLKMSADLGNWLLARYWKMAWWSSSLYF